jgi:perosamine synthetase
MIPIAEPDLDGNELAYLTDCIRSGWVSSRGAYVPRFEENIANWCGSRYAVSTSSGTSALHLALLAIGVGPGDEVILPALTYVASANAVAYTGAQPVFVDVELSSWNLDLNQVSSKVTPHTKAILPVHLYGHPVDMQVCMEIAEQRGLWVIEDACEAHGAEHAGRRVGSIGHIGCFSFFGNKLITTGEGGMLLTDSRELANIARSLRDQAKTPELYWHSEIGFNYRMTNLQAAIGVAQMERVDQFVAARRRIARLYDGFFRDTAGLILYREPAWGMSVCWLYSLLVEPESGLDRDHLIEYLAGREIESRTLFKPLPSVPAYRDGQSYPVAERLSQTGFSLPSSVKLEPKQIEDITQAVICGLKAPHRGESSKHARLSGQPRL